MNKIICDKTENPASDTFPHLSFDEFPVYDHRYLPRWEANNKAYYHLKGAHVIYRTQIKDLNALGACLYVTNEVCVNQTLELKIYLSQRENFEVRGTVIWTTHTFPNDLSWAGIMFEALSPEIQNLILEDAFNVNIQ